jgi:hypothetical protein
MHANDGSLAENWIIERGGWQLDRVNKAFGTMLGTTQADQRVSRVLIGWRPKEGARLPSLTALEEPILGRARTLQALVLANTTGFPDSALNLGTMLPTSSWRRSSCTTPTCFAFAPPAHTSRGCVRRWQSE